jgi:uncharacterized repeat protein (TIGR04138 family)
MRRNLLPILKTLAADSAGVAPAAVDLVDAAIHRVSHLGKGSISANQIWTDLLMLAYENYGDMAKAELERLSIRSSEDAGKIVFALADVGLVKPEGCDCPEDFCRLPELESLVVSRDPQSERPIGTLEPLAFCVACVRCE